jgi:RNA polymerase sigma-70 factor (ECF subfamily)
VSLAGGPDEQGRDDRALLEAHVAGDPEAFGTLFARHRDRLWAVALRTTGDPEDAADALQDAMIAAFRRAGSYRGDAAVTTWLHRVVVNACLDRLRRRRVRRADPIPDDLEERVGRQLPADGPGVLGGSGEVVDPQVLAVDRERRRAVLAALEQLPPDQRAALVLVDMEGYSVEETAAILQCAPGTVKSRCSRARAKLLPLLVEHRRTRPVGADPPGNPDPAPRVPSGRPERGPDPPAGGRTPPGAGPGGRRGTRPRGGEGP